MLKTTKTLFSLVASAVVLLGSLTSCLKITTVRPYMFILVLVTLPTFKVLGRVLG